MPLRARVRISTRAGFELCRNEKLKGTFFGFVTAQPLVSLDVTMFRWDRLNLI